IFRVRAFFIFLAMVLMIMVQTNIQVECVPSLSTPTSNSGCTWSCPPCATARPYHCNIACTEIC
ncbi:18931_t:CDS:2, partial [Gigaspora rosea]